jgi:hypothetical protein
MTSDFEALVRINEAINVAEDGGRTADLSAVLAPAFAMRRASGATVDRAAFLQSVATSGPRTLTIKSIAVLGQERAIVTCTVSMRDQDVPRTFDNLRVFVRAEGTWKLLAWANEPV